MGMTRNSVWSEAENEQSADGRVNFVHVWHSKFPKKMFLIFFKLINFMNNRSTSFGLTRQNITHLEPHNAPFQRSKHRWMDLNTSFFPLTWQEQKETTENLYEILTHPHQNTHIYFNFIFYSLLLCVEGRGKRMNEKKTHSAYKYVWLTRSRSLSLSEFLCNSFNFIWFLAWKNKVITSHVDTLREHTLHCMPRGWLQSLCVCERELY